MSKSVEKPSAKEETKKSAEKVQQKHRANGKTPKEIMKKHLADKNDVISDDEFKNMVVGASVPDDTAHTPVDLRKKHPKDEDKDPEMLTPWDVISE